MNSIQVIETLISELQALREDLLAQARLDSALTPGVRQQFRAEIAQRFAALKTIVRDAAL